jgi:hypothetical protein
VVLAARGLREQDDGRTLVRISRELLAPVRDQARGVWLMTAVITAAVTLLMAAVGRLRG